MAQWPLGTIVSVEELQEGIAFCQSIGLETLQLRLGDASRHDLSVLRRICASLRDFPALTATAGWSGPAQWDFRGGPRTLGLGPPETRRQRMDSLMGGLECAAALNIPLVQTHLGFVPEDPACDEYAVFVECLQKLGRRSGELGVMFCLETGQETPIALRRLIEDAGEKAVGVNLDPANLLMYGKANPVDAVDLLGEHIRSMHLKDGCYPGADSYALGTETPIGEGGVDFLAIFAKLHALGFAGPLIIEREVERPRQRADIAASVPLLRRWMREARQA